MFIVLVYLAFLVLCSNLISLFVYNVYLLSMFIVLVYFAFLVLSLYMDELHTIHFTASLLRSSLYGIMYKSVRIINSFQFNSIASDVGHKVMLRT